MTAGCSPTETMAREFAAKFGDKAFADAAELLTEDGYENVVKTFPPEFQEGHLDAKEALEQYWWGLYGQYGDFKRVGDVDAENSEVTVELNFADGSEIATVDIGEEGVSGLSFSPKYRIPDYVDRHAFTERNVTIDAGDVDLDGVLAIPNSDRPSPGVVLVHGHGIHDSNGTVGATKILKDVAWGLASEGIASLRYEKRLNEHEVADENYTLDTVVTDDAVVAVSELIDADEVDADNVFVAGHSQGGMCAPRIADRHEDVAGIVILDGTADPIVDPDDLVWLRYSMELDGDLSKEQKEEFEAQRETFRRISDGDFDADDTIMGQPGVWHQSHHNCNPMATASDLDRPVFVMKTGRANKEMQLELYESLRKKFEEWHAVDLPDGSRTEFYENADHYFQDGPAPVTPTCLYFGGNVEGYVIKDITEWIRSVANV